MTDQPGWRSGDAQPTPPSTSPDPRRRRYGAAAGLLGAGAVAGAILAGTLSAQAATPSSTPSPSATASTGTTQATPGDTDAGHRGRLNQSGTVTAVGSSSVTIKTASGTTQYAVTTSSDIDKNGEAKLSDLKVGDAVTFSTTTVSGKSTIDKLHAGNESLDAPHGHNGTTAG